MKKLVFGLLVAVSLVLSVGCAFATVDISQTHWKLPERGFSGGSRVHPVDTVLTYTDLSALRNSLNDSMQSRSAQLTYSGSFYFITMVRDGDIYWLCNGNGGRYRTAVEASDNTTSTTVPSTSAPTVSENTNTTYVPGPSSDLSVLTPSNELQALKYINQTAIHIANETHRIIEYLRDTERYVFRLYLNVGRVIDGLNSIISGVYRQADLLAGYLPRLDDTVNRLTDIRSASWASVDVENRILSSSIKIGSLLSSVVQNGQLQVNTSPLENRLDKLISMYSKVNSVVLDTASINGGSITDAVGGELKDVVFWGDTSEVNNTFVSADGVAYTLNDTPVDINGLTLRSVNLGSTIPSYIANDPVLYAGVWRKGTDYIISDTYNASTGEYVKRVENFVFSSDSISFDDCCYFERGGNTQLFCITLPVFPVPYDSAFNSNWSSSYRPVPYQAPFWCWENNDSNVDAFLDCFVFYEDRFLIVTSVKGALGNLRNWFCNLSPQFSFLYVPDPSLGWMPSVCMFDPSTIAIPDGNSYISSYNVRITGKYETYDSYTQTADIITAINNIPPVDLDLTPLSSRLDTLNTTISSVISHDKLKVDNSPVVTWLETINTTLTTNGGHSSTVDLSTIETTLSKICDKLDDAAVNVNNTVVNITNDNDKFNVFYITDVNGKTQPITEFAGDLTGASGKLLSLLYRLVFADALGGVDDDFSGFEDFFTSQEPVTATQGVDDIVDEVADVWAS